MGNKEKNSEKTMVERMMQTYILPDDLQLICADGGKVKKKNVKDVGLANDYLRYTVAGVSTLSRHANHVLTKPPKIQTGVPELSNVIGGGYPVGGLTVIGGAPNVGKTTLAVQSAVNMSKEGTPSLFLSLDMSEYEIINKVYSQVSYELNGVKGYTLKDIADKKLFLKNEDNKKIIKKVNEIGKYMTVVDMMNETVLSWITERKKAENEYKDTMWEKICCLLDTYTDIYEHPVVFIDNLQQLVGYAGDDVGKVGVDKAINTLKLLARTYEVPIVLISILNRSSYEKPIDLTAFKESGAIDFAVSTAIGIEPKYVTDGDTEMNMDVFRESPRRDITIKCIKSRDSGYERKYVTLNAPFCMFEPYDAKHPSYVSKKRKGKVFFVDDDGDGNDVA